MAGKYNTPHPDRSQSRYPDRLRKRGVTNVDVRMDDLPTLRKRAGRDGTPAAPEDQELGEYWMETGR